MPLPWALPQTVGCRGDRTTAKRRTGTLASLDEAIARFPRGPRRVELVPCRRLQRPRPDDRIQADPATYRSFRRTRPGVALSHEGEQRRPSARTRAAHSVRLVQGLRAVAAALVVGSGTRSTSVGDGPGRDRFPARPTGIMARACGGVIGRRLNGLWSGRCGGLARVPQSSRWPTMWRRRAGSLVGCRAC
jgi:hypothetical protein